MEREGKDGEDPGKEQTVNSNPPFCGTQEDCALTKTKRPGPLFSCSVGEADDGAGVILKVIDRSAIFSQVEGFIIHVHLLLLLNFPQSSLHHGESKILEL